jgi:hypothetical protein
MNKTKQLQRLLRLARKAERPVGEPGLLEAPLGFSTRVAARWAEQRRRPALMSLWERACWLGAAASLVVCLSARVYQANLPEPDAFDVLMDAPMAETEIF